MIRVIRPIGNSCGLIIDKAVLDLLNLQAGSSVDVTLAPGGKGILITPVRRRMRSAARRRREGRAQGPRPRGERACEEEAGEDLQETR